MATVPLHGLPGTRKAGGAVSRDPRAELLAASAVEMRALIRQMIYELGRCPHCGALYNVPMPRRCHICKKETK